MIAREHALGRGTARAARKARRGFTLIELMIALIAGLIVAMGVVGLSRDATHTFHEEMRGSAAEAALRTAVDRLRGDLQRAGYMSTGNIILDPTIAKAPGATNLANQVSPGILKNGLGMLASIYRVPGGSYKTNLKGAAVDLSANNNVSPDLIQVGGNMTSSDQFPVQLIAQAPGANNCTEILLSLTSPAMYRVLASGMAAPQTLHDIFQPVPAGDSNQFIVRLVDDTGHSQYLLTCPSAGNGSTTTGGAAGITGLTGGGGGGDGGASVNLQNAQAFLMVDTSKTTIMTSRAAGTNGGVSGFAAGVAWVNPVQIVQWEVTMPAGTPTDPEPAQDESILAGTSLTPSTPDPAKFDLMRSYVDAVTGKIIPDTSEIVAEYAVDFDFAFSVDLSTNNLLPNVVTYGFEDPTDNDIWAYPDVQTQGVAAVQGPQRIRAVRARVVTRTAQPDRNVNIAVANYGSQEFMYRYQIDATDYARARTIVTQVSLPNQERNFY
jgi:prepilin-type N-terminal cleavage/methylation domain-containing protein